MMSKLNAAPLKGPGKKKTEARATSRAGPRVAICLTGAMKMNPDAAPFLAQHTRSHVTVPWDADAFVVIEVLSTLAESRALHQYFKILQPRHMIVYCPKRGCHSDVAKWCRGASCETRLAQPARPMWTSRRTLKHCEQPVKMTPTYEWQSEKRRVCFDQIVKHEKARAGQHQYDYIAYQRPEDWSPTKRSVQELSLLDESGGIWVNNGLCHPDCTTCKRGKEFENDPPA
eukprot:448116-Prymnesium_polylepis.1